MTRKKKRADGRVTVTKTYNGKRKFFYGATNAEAERKREEYEKTQEKKAYSNDILYDEWLDEWLSYTKDNVSASTFVNYKTLINKHLRHDLGFYTLIELSSPLIRDYISSKREKLSARTTSYIYTLLKSSLKLAVDDDILPKNPMDKLRKPKKEPLRKIVALTMEQAKSLLAEIQEEDIYRLFYVALGTGFRRSEILGLRWQDIDYSKKTLTVSNPVIKIGAQVVISKETKNKQSERTIYVNDSILDILKKQRKFVLEKRLKSLGYIDNDLVFPGDNGDPCRPDRISRIATKYGKQTGMPESFSFHALRHTHATLLLKAGVHFKVVQVRLGHSTFQQTMDTYSHVTPDMDRAAAEKASCFV